MPLLTFTVAESPGPNSTATEESEVLQRQWYHYLPLCFTFFLILAPHPSLLIMLIGYYWKSLHSPTWFTIHLLATYTLTFLAICSLIVCAARDPGSVRLPAQNEDVEDEDGEMGLTDALLSGPQDDEYLKPGRWCRKCWAPKPERTHHCSICGRCVLKMDHHCPWVGSKCIGHRTYPAFVHFLFFVTLLAGYISVIAWRALYYTFTTPFSEAAMDLKTPLHELGLALVGVIFSIAIGSFFAYHLYLITTNQTTLENLSPFLLLRHLPPLPPSTHPFRSRLSDPPEEHELNTDQRHLVRYAHSAFRMYDVGWRENWRQVFGWRNGRGLLRRCLYGGGSPGDGTKFPRNPRTEELLQRLASELSGVDKDR